jgi:hypothetical protein
MNKLLCATYLGVVLVLGPSVVARADFGPGPYSWERQL